MRDLCNLIRVIVVLGGALTSVMAQEDSVAAETVRKLVEQLGSGQLQERVDAERVLRELGPAALPHLPDPRLLDDGPAAAVQRIRAHLERAQALQALEPSLVTVSEHQTLNEVAETVERQTGNVIDLSALPHALLTRQMGVEFDRKRFWEAITLIERENGIELHVGEGRTVVARRPAAAEPSRLTEAIAGPFRVTAVSAVVRPDFTNPERRLLRSTLLIQTEPRLLPLFAHWADADIDVTAHHADETVTFPVLSPVAKHELPINPNRPLRILHDVMMPPRDNGDFDSVAVNGTIAMEVATGQVNIEFRNLDEPGPVTRRVGGMRVTRMDIGPAGSDIRATLQIAYDADGPRYESHRAWVFHNGVVLISGDQQRRPVDFETLEEGEGGATLRYRFEDMAPLPETAVLQYTAPTLITRVPVEFTFDELPITE